MTRFLLAFAVAIALDIPAAAQDCTLATVKGTYTYSNSGFAVTQDNFFFFAGMGVLTADGDGRVEGKDTTSTDGQIQRRSWTGTYRVNEDCTGTMSIRVSTPAGTFTGAFDIVANPNGKEVQFIQTDTGAVIQGTAKRQGKPKK
jgi:hypothetical protein